MPDEFKLLSAQINGRHLVVNASDGKNERINLRRITDFELRHDVEPDGKVWAYVGYRNLNRRLPFATRSVDKRLVGLLSGEADVGKVRRTFDQVGVPAIEF